MGSRPVESAGVDDETGETLVITSPGELVASIPGLLGFMPSNLSLVVLCTGGPVIRLDVPELDDPEMIPVSWWAVDVLRDFCLREDVDDMHVVLVHDGCCTPGEDQDAALELIDSLYFWVEQTGCRVAGVIGVDRIATGLPWRDLSIVGNGQWGGFQEDPESTQAAMGRVMSGSVGYSSREEVAQLYARRDEGVGPGPRRGYRRPSDATAEREIALLRDAARDVESGARVDDARLATVGRCLRSKRVRDEMLLDLFRRPLGAVDGRRELWWGVARRMPQAERAEALVLLGTAAYLSGEGVHASSAFDCAIEANPDCRLALLLSRALRQGVPPDRLRSWFSDLAGQSGPDPREPT